MKDWKVCLFVFITTQLVFSCFQVYDPVAEGQEITAPFSEGSEIEENSEYNEDESEYKDKIFTEEDGKIILHTNNKKYWSVRGYTLWKFFPANKEVKEIKVKKLEGDNNGGYGFICYRNKGEKDRFLCILIYTDGRYSVGNVVDGKYTGIVYKQESTNLLKGSGATNVIRTEQVGKSIKIFFTEKNSGTDADYVIENSEEYKPGNDGSGMIAVISPKDNFPKTYVSIEYNKK